MKILNHHSHIHNYIIFKGLCQRFKEILPCTVLSNSQSMLQVMPRSENAHALVNAGFLYKLKTGNVVDSARIVFGALSPSFIRASATEKYLKGKKLFTNETLTAAVKILEAELVVEDNPPDPSVEYRKNCALGLFYKVSFFYLK